MTHFPDIESQSGHAQHSFPRMIHVFQMPVDFRPFKSAEAWQISNPPILSMAALLASLEIFHEAGMKRLRAKGEQLTSYLESLITAELEDQVEIITPSQYERRGCQLSIRIHKPIENITEILHEGGVISDWREPDVLRIAPVPLYNSFEDCHEFVQILKMARNGS